MSWKERDLPYNSIPNLPPLGIDLESRTILKATINANKYLAELKGYCQKLPDPNILINTIILQESKDSSAIENIVTTQDELYKGMLLPFEELTSNVKEVISYKEAMHTGLVELKRTSSFTVSLAIKVMQKIKMTDSGLRANVGTKLKNPISDEIIYSPPDPHIARERLFDLETYLNPKIKNDLDPLIQMALMHYQFEAIHPFSDGNGRTGRILNVLFMVHHDLLQLPVLYLSSYIIHNKSDYYKNLRLVTEDDYWEGWILFMLKAIEETSISTLTLIKKINDLKTETLDRLKKISTKFPAHDINELLFSYPYIKIKLLEDSNLGTRNTVSNYLKQMTNYKIVQEVKIGQDKYFVNRRLMKILSNS